MSISGHVTSIHSESALLFEAQVPGTAGSNNLDQFGKFTLHTFPTPHSYKKKTTAVSNMLSSEHSVHSIPVIFSPLNSATHNCIPLDGVKSISQSRNASSENEPNDQKCVYKSMDGHDQ